MGSFSDKFTRLSAQAMQATDNVHEQKDQKKADKKAEAKSEKSFLSRLADGEKEARQELIQDSMGLLKSQPQKQIKQLQERAGKEMEQLFGKKDSYDDNVKLTSQFNSRETVQTEQKKQVKEQSKKIVNEKEFSENQKTEVSKFEKNLGMRERTLDEQNKAKKKVEVKEKGEQGKEERVKDRIKEYSSVLTELLVAKTPQQKQKLEEIKQQLREEGYSNRNILKMESSTTNMVRQHTVLEIKNQLLKVLFSTADSKFSQNIKKYSMAVFIEGIKDNEALGGKEFGNYKGGVDKIITDSVADERGDIKNFITDEIENAFIKYAGVEKDQDKLNAEFDKLRNFCTKTCGSIDLRAIMARIKDSVNDLGILAFLPPENPNQSFSFSEGDERGREKKKEETIYISEEDKLKDKLRVLYFKKALNPGIRGTIELTFKIRKVKNQLLKLGISDKEEINQLEEQGKFLAKEHFLENLDKVFLEQATLQELSGPSYDIIRDRKAYLISSLKKVGYKITKEELDKIRDKANREMFPVLKEELNKLEIMEDIKRSIFASRKRKTLIAILERLKEESKIADIINSNNDNDGGFVERTIVEAA